MNFYIGCPVPRKDGLEDNIISIGQTLYKVGCKTFAHFSVVALFRVYDERKKEWKYLDCKPEPIDINRDVDKIRDVTACIFDVGLDSSHDVGYQLAMAESRGIPTLLLCSHKAEGEVSKPFFLEGNGHTKRVYDGEGTIPGVVAEFVKELNADKEHMENRADGMPFVASPGRERR